MNKPNRAVVINNCFGGFSLSEAAVERLKQLGLDLNPRPGIFGITHDQPERDDPRLVQVVREMGDAANGKVAALKVVEIPDDVDWEVEEYDGSEWISEKHRTWY